MIDLSDLLLPQTVTERLAAANKKALFQQLGVFAGEAYGFDPVLVTECVVAREKLGSTGFGAGVATPHGKLPGLDRVRGVFARLAQPIDFAAVDDVAVDIVFMLLSPPDAGAEHLKALARVSRLLRDRNCVAKLRGAGSQDAIYALLTADDARHAA
jgi:PTS system nitrogen regulatory IIA component